MESLRLVTPSLEFRDSYMSYYQDWTQSGEKIIPWVAAKDPTNFELYVADLYAQDNEAKVAGSPLVPHTTYWLTNAQQEIVGVSNIRHRLNEKLLKSGGHIGYGIAPSYRRMGYATQLLKLSLEVAKKLGIERALLVCHEWNTASERTIIRNGGIFESHYIEDDGTVLKRYWIST